MNKLKLKMMLIVTFIMVICIAPAVVLATNENIQIYQNQDNEYLVYIKDLVNQEFKFAISSTNEEPLGYINSGKDKEENGNNVAYLSDEQVAEDELYIWVKKDDSYVVKGEKLDVIEALHQNQIEQIEKHTKIIKVDTTQKTKTEEVVDGVKKTKVRGKIVITDNDSAIYEYKRVKVDEDEKYNQLNNLAEKIKKEFSEMNMYEKLEATAEYDKMYNDLIENANWENVENMTIEQPEQSKTGDRYIVLIKKTVDGQNVYDIQYMTCYDEYDEGETTEQVVVKKTSKLPITYDNPILLVVLAIVIIAIVIIAVRIVTIKRTKGNE